MLARLAHLDIRRRWLIIPLAVVAFVVAGAVGGGVAEELSSGGFENPDAESSRAEDLLLEELGTGTPNLVLLVTADEGRTVDDPAVVATGQAITDRLAGEAQVANVVSYWSLQNAPPLRTEDGSRALVLARIEGNDDEVNDLVEEIVPRYEGEVDGVTVAATGQGPVFYEVGTTIEDDLLRAELIAVPITLVLLLLVFGSVVAATLPLAIGALAVVGTFVVLRLLNQVTEVSVFALNLTTAMGLGLAIDYSLFVVSRFREELRAGQDTNDAVVRTVRTAGRTVAFSALTVAASLCALLVFPLAFLRSFAYAGVAVALLAGLISVVVLPAILAALGHRVDKLTLWRHSTRPDEHGFWHRMATLVMRRPLPIATAVLALLLFLGSPVVGLSLGLPDDRVLPEDASSREANDVIRDEFSSEDAGALAVVATGTGDPTARAAEVDAYAAGLSELEGVGRVDAFTGTYLDGQLVRPGDGELYRRFASDDATFLSVVPSVEPMSGEGEDLVRALRSFDGPFPEVQVTGQSAFLVDSKEALFDLMPLAAGIIVVITFVLLFLMFGSLVVPVKAFILNLLSLSATFGAMVWVFQDGNLSETLEFTATGSIAASMPILMFCVAFGLSMDYEVFLLSRIKEEHDRTGDNVSSVALGLERTGRIVTAAAVLISVVFLAFATSQISFVKLFGIGLTLAVVMDAFLIRGTLVPAFMRLAGEANWWAPGPLRRLHARFGFQEVVDLDAESGDGRSGTGQADERELEPVGGGG